MPNAIGLEHSSYLQIISAMPYPRSHDVLPMKECS